MKTEFEIKFYPVERVKIQERLRSIGAVCVSPRTFMRRAVFENPNNPENSFARVRDEGGVITCTFKDISPNTLSIESVREIECEVSDFESMKNIFLAMGVRQKAFQESYREVWEVSDEWVQFMLDEWPGLELFIEIEAETEEKAREYVDRLGFRYEEGFFGGSSVLYEAFLWLPRPYMNTLPEVTFDNPPRKVGDFSVW